MLSNINSDHVKPRKRSLTNVTLVSGTGRIIVNRKPGKFYFQLYSKNQVILFSITATVYKYPAEVQLHREPHIVVEHN